MPACSTWILLANSRFPALQLEHNAALLIEIQIRCRNYLHKHCPPEWYGKGPDPEVRCEWFSTIPACKKRDVVDNMPSGPSVILSNW